MILIYLFWVHPVWGASSLSVHEVVERALARDQQLRKGRKQYLYDYKLIIEKLDRNNHVLQEEQSKTTLRCDEKMRYGASTSLDSSGKPSTASQDQKQSDQKKWKDSQKRIAVMNLKKLAPRFELHLVGTELVDGTSCYILSFSPKKDQPYDSREEKVVNQLSGAFWIDQKTFSIVKSSGQLKKPVSAIPFLASVRDLSFVYKTLTLPNQQPAPASFTLLYDVQTPFTYIRKREMSAMEKYRLAN